MDDDSVSDPQGQPSHEEPPEDSSHPDIGRLIADRYRLEARLGGGAMGTVWSGTDELLRRPVAVKAVRLPPGMPERDAEELRERTLREARAIAVVSHPNVVTLYDVARDDGDPFVVMELVPSQSLAVVLREHGPLDERQLATITDSVASALETAHRSGIIHRDIKPGNVLLGEYGNIKISDFGISRNLSEATLTRTGIMLGTPAFIAPEVAAGESVGVAADLWGLGATLFAASEGHPPYDEDGNPMATVSAVVRGPVPEPTRTGPIGEIITALMVKDPHRRMSLPDVRRHVQSLLPPPGSQPFGELIAPEVPTVRVRTPTATAPAQWDKPDRQGREERQEAPEREPSGSAQQAPEDHSPARLAADPGPLPFALREPTPPRRSPWSVVALMVGMLLVFALAVGAGFAASRTWAGRTILPTSTTPTTQPDPRPRLVPYVDRARHPGDSGEGRFRITMPEGWTVFHGYRSGPPTRSMTVHIVSPDGRTALAVQRFGGYYTRGYTTQGYLNALPEITKGPEGTFRLTISRQVRPSAGTGSDRYLSYESVTRGVLPSANSAAHRTTFARLMPRSGDLWIVRATVPSDRASRGKALFDRVLPGFEPLP
ncbi:serine/threonine protein kinase [Halopolyspora algeriensis]|uniref:non-specific serine/threonine protein kinase n=1 Tax=Halopolyspora algeriensis TaxID=1500506 RepID=A0A368VRT9_9ACTN|nr:serine/threonine-protein kinase [Halopolyspora algeriensis]RCW43725.1 serine/threonine protein kinase [Halopolyspora algeriensis]TQM47492.1 serine/threonine protein kinase [Halopolyspora algeriensis]